MINIDTGQVSKKLRKFWTGAVFHPTDAIEDDWGKRILDRIADDKALDTIRIYTMMEDIVTLDEQGNMQYDFTLNDYRLDYLLSRGFHILLAYAFLPPWLCADADRTSAVSKNKTRYKGKMIVASYATDYSKWQEICRAYTAHIVERYGEDVVATWQLQCYNEANIEPFFMKGEKDPVRRSEEYCKLYDGFEAGIRAVSEKLCIGGPAMAEPRVDEQFLIHFLRHIRQHKRKLDFISFHTYGCSPAEINSGERPLHLKNSLPSFDSVLRICKEEGFADLPLICDEWGAACSGFYNIEECPGLWFRETEMYAAYFTKMLTLYDEMDLPLDMMMICLSGQHEMVTDFSGFRNFFTLNFYPKPIYNAHILASRLGTDKLCFELTDRMDPTVAGYLSVLPTRHEDGHISILLAYADDAFLENLPDTEITLNLMGLQQTAKVQLTRIDKDHANAYTGYCRLGKPDTPTEAQKEDIHAFACCHTEDYGTVSPTDPQFLLPMTNHAVVLIEITP